MFKGKCKQTHMTYTLTADITLSATRDLVYTARDNNYCGMRSKMTRLITLVYKTGKASEEALTSFTSSTTTAVLHRHIN